MENEEKRKEFDKKYAEEQLKLKLETEEKLRQVKLETLEKLRENLSKKNEESNWQMNENEIIYKIKKG